jgi:hypothetical protein
VLTRLPVFPRAAVEQDAWRPAVIQARYSVIGEEGCQYEWLVEWVNQSRSG